MQTSFSLFPKFYSKRNLFYKFNVATSVSDFSNKLVMVLKFAKIVKCR